MGKQTVFFLKTEAFHPSSLHELPCYACLQGSRTDFKLFVFGFRWAYNRLSVDDQDSVLINTIGLEPDPVFSGRNFNNLGLCGDGIADSHRGYKIQFLANIDGTVTWQSISENGRYQSGAQHAMGDAGFKEGLPRI